MPSGSISGEGNVFSCSDTELDDSLEETCDEYHFPRSSGSMAYLKNSMNFSSSPRARF